MSSKGKTHHEAMFSGFDGAKDVTRLSCEKEPVKSNNNLFANHFVEGSHASRKGRIYKSLA